MTIDLLLGAGFLLSGQVFIRAQSMGAVTNLVKLSALSTACPVPSGQPSRQNQSTSLPRHHWRSRRRSATVAPRANTIRFPRSFS